MRGALMALVGLVLFGCSYEFSEEQNFVAVQKPGAPNPVTIDLEQIGEGDTLYVYQPVNLKYAITGVSPAYIRSINLVLGNSQVVYQLTSLSGTVSFVPPTLTKGVFQLRLTVHARTGTGSLADQVGAEVLVYERQWPVFINTMSPDPLHITSVAKDKGSLKVTWEKFPYAGFSSYMLVRVKGSSYKTFYINQQDSTSMYDKEFLTGEVSYSVTLFTGNGQNNVQGIPTTYSDNSGPMLVSKEVVNGNQIKLTWSRGSYPANVKQFEIRVGEGSSGYFENGVVIQHSTNTIDTTEIIPATLGMQRQFFVRASPSLFATWSNDTEHVIKSTPFVAGETFDSYEEIRFSTPANRFYTLSMMQLRAYDMSTGALVRSFALSDRSLIEVTQSGDKLVHVYNRQAYVYDAVTLNLSSQFNLSAELAATDALFTIAVSADNMLYVSRSRVTQIGGFQVGIPAILVYNLATGALVKIIDEGPLPPNNTFIMSAGNTRVTSNQFIFYEPSTNPNSPFSYGSVGVIQGTDITENETFGWPLPNPSNPNELLNARYNGNKIAVYNWTTKTYGTVYNTFSDFSPTDFLPELNIVVGLRGTMATVFNYVTQQTVYSIQCPGFPIDMHGDYIYSSSGARIKIN